MTHTIGRLTRNIFMAGLGSLFVVLLSIPLAARPASATIDGVSGPAFTFVARAGYISTGDGQSLLVWGYANGSTGFMQYPGPTMIVNQGDTVTVTLTNELSVPVSIVFPGQVNVQASGGVTGTLTSEAPAGTPTTPGGPVTYTFTASHPGTYLYHSGTQQDLEVEMGLVGALIVRPIGADPLRHAYDHPNTAFDHEYLFLLTEMDPSVHWLMDLGLGSQVDFTTYHSTLWFLNGRNAPDTMSEAGADAPWLQHQPYNCMPRMHPGEKVLMRLIGAGRDLHPFHHHGNNAWIIARDGRMLQSAPGAGPDLAESNFTVTVLPGGTADAMFEWTGKGLGWDVYGHNATDPLEPNEYAPDHGKSFPVTLPELQSLTFGGYWSGSPFLGQAEALPPGQGGLNPTNAYHFMWHSHTEREMTNDDIFPGGIMTMLLVEPLGVPIP
jgi:FtsP/CotA-like multicopper oxidase with cupredoxin domain